MWCWWQWSKLCWWFCTGRGRSEYLLMIWIVRSALCKLTQIPNNNIELKYYFRAQKYFQVRPGFAGSDMTPDGLDGSISGHHYYILFLHLLAEEPAGADTYFWLQELNVSLFCLVAAQTCPDPPSCWPEEAAEIKLPSLQCTRCWLVCHGGTWSSLSQVNEGLALPSFLVAFFFLWPGLSWEWRVLATNWQRPNLFIKTLFYVLFLSLYLYTSLNALLVQYFSQ